MSYTVEGTQQLANLASVNIRPSTSDEWVIHNIYIPAGASVEVYRWNDIGTSPQILITKTSYSLLFQSLHCTLTGFIVIKNISGSSIYIGYDGVILE